MSRRNTSVVLVALCIATTQAQLLCYQCEDCYIDPTKVQACGINIPVSTTQYPGAPGATTPPNGNWPSTPILTPPGGGGGGGGGEVTLTTLPPANPTNGPILTPPDGGTTVNPPTGSPILTPPSWPGDNGSGGTTTGGPGEPILTPPTLPGGGGSGSSGNGGPGSISSTKWPNVVPVGAYDSPLIDPVNSESTKTHVCVMTRSMVNNREVVRRGCARLGPSNDATCNSVTGGSHHRCTLLGLIPGFVSRDAMRYTCSPCDGFSPSFVCGVFANHARIRPYAKLGETQSHGEKRTC